jgi:hypothetical protein
MGTGSIGSADATPAQGQASGPTAGNGAVLHQEPDSSVRGLLWPNGRVGPSVRSPKRPTRGEWPTRPEAALGRRGSLVRLGRARGSMPRPAWGRGRLAVVPNLDSKRPRRSFPPPGAAAPGPRWVERPGLRGRWPTLGMPGEAPDHRPTRKASEAAAVTWEQADAPERGGRPGSVHGHAYVALHRTPLGHQALQPVGKIQLILGYSPGRPVRSRRLTSGYEFRGSLLVGLCQIGAQAGLDS